MSDRLGDVGGNKTNTNMNNNESRENHVDKTVSGFFISAKMYDT